MSLLEYNPFITPITKSAIKLHINNIFFMNSSFDKETNAKGIKGMLNIMTKDANVANADIIGVFLDLEISTKLLYLDIPMEKPSAHRLARPNTSA